MWGRACVAGSVAAVVVVSSVVVAGCGGSPTSVVVASSSVLGSDDPLNTNSTKDLSLVTATLDSADNPYQVLLPSMCTRIPVSAWVAAGTDPVRMPPKDSLGPTNTLLRGCQTGIYNGSRIMAAVSVTIYPFPSSEFFDDANKQILKRDTPIGSHLATTFVPKDNPDHDCEVAYPTFFGIVDFGATNFSDVQGFDLCAASQKIADALYPFVPTRPSEMRRTP